jgi:hypothetical protein
MENGGSSLETNLQTNRNIKVVTKKKISIRIVLNIYGVFTVFALILSIFTNPISVNQNMQLFFNENLMMESKEIKEFLLFISGSAIVYFSLVNLYYKYVKN